MHVITIVLSVGWSSSHCSPQAQDEEPIGTITLLQQHLVPRLYSSLDFGMFTFNLELKGKVMQQHQKERNIKNHRHVQLFEFIKTIGMLSYLSQQGNCAPTKTQRHAIHKHIHTYGTNINILLRQD